MTAWKTGIQRRLLELIVRNTVLTRGTEKQDLYSSLWVQPCLGNSEATGTEKKDVGIW